MLFIYIICNTKKWIHKLYSQTTLGCLSGSFKHKSWIYKPKKGTVLKQLCQEMTTVLFVEEGMNNYKAET